MADQVLTKQKLINADEDVQALEDVVNGEPGKLVKTRLGREVYTLASVPQINTMTREEVAAAVAPKANKADVDSALSTKAPQATTYTKMEVDALTTPKADKIYVDQLIINSNNNITNYQTQAALLAFTPTQANYTAKALDTKKVWYWDGTKWNDTGLSEYDLAKEFANSNALFKPVALTNTSNLNDYRTNGFYRAISTSVASLDRNFPVVLGGVLEVFERSVDSCQQRYTCSQGIYVRQYIGTWSSWEKYAKESDVTTTINTYLLGINSVAINKGKAYPQKALIRGGSVSNASNTLNNLILGVRVIGAEPGKYYKIEWIGNNTTSLGVPTGWRIASYDAANFSNSTSADRTLVVDYTTPQAELDRTGINKITIKSVVVSGLIFEIIYDGTALPVSGTYIRASNTSDNAYSWIIDPLCYEYSTASETVGAGLQTITYSASTNEFFVDFKSGSDWYRWVFGKNGYNNLPNFKGISKSTDGKSWTDINSSLTDWLPPLRIQAVNNGDGRSKFATGGNHGNLNGGAQGDQTARNVLFQVFADGSLLTDSVTTSAAVVDVVVVNEIMGWNTTQSESYEGRYILRQTFNLTFKGGSVEVTANNTALEDLNLARDSALQFVCTGLTNQMCFYGKSLKEAYVDTASSGKYSDYPDVVAAGAFSADTQLIMWMDHNFGKGDMSWIQDDSPLVRFSGAKCYMAVALDVDENQVNKNYTVPLLGGESYQYRGGYSLQKIQTVPGVDSSFIKHISGKSISTILMSTNQLIEV